MMDRRQLLKGALGGMAGLLAPRLSAAQASGITRLTSTVSLINGVGTNVVVLSTSDELILVDSGAPQFGSVLRTRLAELAGTRRIQTVFNTHYHLENTASNEALTTAGARIVAHETTRTWMATPYWIPSENRYEKARPKGAHPTETFYISGSLKAGAKSEEQIDYGYLINAHTSGDIYVLFRNANVLVVGDVASPARDPQLDYFTGAWIGGRVDALDRLLELSDDKTQIVPGTGPVMKRSELKVERDMMSTIYDRAVDRVREADSPDDMIKAGVMNGLPRSFEDPRRFLYDLHKGLWAHHNKLAPNVV